MSNLARTSFLLVPLFWFNPDSGSACQCIQKTGISQSVPANGATDVPTDVSIWANAAEVRLVDANGETVPTETRVGDFTMFGSGTCISLREIVPEAPLEPLSEYTLVSLEPPSLDDVGSITFTTGEGPIQGVPPAAPDVEVAFFDATNRINSCFSATYQVCKRGSVSDLVEVRIERPEMTERFVAPFDFWSSLELWGNEGCIEIRARDISGRLSEPSTHCFEPGSFPVLPALDPDEFPSVDCSSEDIQALFANDAQSDESSPSEAEPLNAIDERDRNSSGITCSVSASGRSATAELLVLLGLLFLGCQRRLGQRLLR